MNEGEDRKVNTPSDLSTLAISLLKGVVYRESDERNWGALISLQSHLRDYVAVLGLEVVVDEAEGYAFLKSRYQSADDTTEATVPRLIARRQLSFPVSLLLALLRRKLLEFDAIGGETRLVMTRDQIAELMRVFLKDSSNEVKLLDQMEAHMTKVTELGFLRRLKTSGGPPTFEVQRILKAFIDAQWLTTFDEQLKLYLAHITTGEVSGGAHID
jgi:hypothetical protein